MPKDPTNHDPSHLESRNHNEAHKRMFTPNADGSPKRKNRRSPLQRYKDRAIVSELYMRGKTIIEIVEIMRTQYGEEITFSNVKNDLIAMRDNWRNAALMDFDTALSKELARLDQLERTYWSAWELSLKKKEIATAEKIEDTTGADKEHAFTRTKTKRMSVERDGNVLYLQGIERVISQRAKLLGLNAPQRYEINWRREAEKYNIDPEVMQEGLVNEFVEAARRGASTRPPVSEKALNEQLKKDGNGHIPL